MNNYYTKYLKYKNKYLELKKIGGNRSEVIDEKTATEYLKNIYLVSSQEQFMFKEDRAGNILITFETDREDALKNKKTELEFKKIDQNRKFISENTFSHPYPTTHSTWGELVYPHSKGSWDFSKFAVIFNATQYKDAMYKLNPYDTMFLSSDIIISSDDVVQLVMENKFAENLEKENKDIYEKIKDKIFKFDATPLYDIIENDEDLKNFIVKYRENYLKYFGKEDSNITIDNFAQIKELLINLNSYMNLKESAEKGVPINGEISSFFVDLETQKKKAEEKEKNKKITFDPYIFAKSYYKTCIRDAIHIAIKTLIQDKKIMNVYMQIYCNLTDKQDRKHDPECYRNLTLENLGLENDVVDLNSSSDYKKMTYMVDGKKWTKENENSIFGKHSSSLLDTSEGPIKKLTNLIKTTLQDPLDEKKVEELKNNLGSQIKLILNDMNTLKNRKTLQISMLNKQDLKKELFTIINSTVDSQIKENIKSLEQATKSIEQSTKSILSKKELIEKLEKSNPVRESIGKSIIETYDNIIRNMNLESS